jgi:hypothetical protein
MARTIWGMLVLVALALGGTVAVTRCEGTPPAVEAPQRVVVGKAGEHVTITVSDAGAGVRSVSVTLSHAGGEAPLVASRFPGRWLPFGAVHPQTLQVLIDPKALGLKDGESKLIVVARDHSWRGWLAGNETRLEVPVVVDTRAPRISLEPGITYARRGGSLALAYEVSEETRRDGVQVGDHFFPGVRVGVTDPEKQHAAGWRFVLAALPIDAPGTLPVLVAVDVAGNETRVTPDVRVQERGMAEVQLHLPKRFLEQKVPELADAVGVDASDPLKAFQEINTRIRQENEAKIRSIVSESAPEPLFQGAFEQLANSKVTSAFAEHRTDLVDGQKVSESVHYGYDLASIAGSPATASNSGRVLYADALGIYGNCVIIDHGLGLASLYGHLSSIEVKPGDEVSKGQRIGITGQTGLAGGDHLHFAMLVRGVYVDPVEWWDPKWLRDRFDPKLAAARR